MELYQHSFVFILCSESIMTTFVARILCVLSEPRHFLLQMQPERMSQVFKNKMQQMGCVGCYL